MAPLIPFISNLLGGCRKLTWTIVALSVCVSASIEAKPGSESKEMTRQRSVIRSRPQPEATTPPVGNTALYACQDDKGRTTYSQFPCSSKETNNQRQLTQQDRRSPKQVIHSTWMMQRERKLLKTMEREQQRLARQAEASHRKSHVRSSPPSDPARKLQAQRDAKEARPVRYRVLPPLTSNATPTSGRLSP